MYSTVSPSVDPTDVSNSEVVRPAVTGPRNRKLQVLGLCAIAFSVPMASIAYFGSFRVAAAYLKGHRVIAKVGPIDFGRCQSGEVHEFIVPIRNFRNVPVVVTGASISCTCISTKTLLPFTIEAGGTARVRLHARLTAKGERFEQSVSFLTNDAVDSTVRVWIRATLADTVHTSDRGSG